MTCKEEGGDPGRAQCSCPQAQARFSLPLADRATTAEDTGRVAEAAAVKLLLLSYLVPPIVYMSIVDGACRERLW
jgi:hypothetical protein